MMNKQTPGSRIKDQGSRIGIIGIGHMGEGIVRVLKKNGYQVMGGCRDQAQKNALKHLKIPLTTDLQDLIDQCDTVFLCTRPQEFKTIRIQSKQSTQFISIMAGIPIKRIETYLKTKRVIRTAPNLFLTQGQGMTVWKSSVKLSSRERALVKKIFDCFGTQLEVKNESLLNEALAIFGSGPAFVAHLLDAFFHECRRYFPTLDEQFYVRAILDYTQNQQMTLNQLADKIATKGGMTEEGLHVLKKSNLEKIIGQAMKATLKKARRL